MLALCCSTTNSIIPLPSSKPTIEVSGTIQYSVIVHMVKERSPQIWCFQHIRVSNYPEWLFRSCQCYIYPAVITEESNRASPLAAFWWGWNLVFYVRWQSVELRLMHVWFLTFWVVHWMRPNARQDDYVTLRSLKTVHCRHLNFQSRLVESRYLTQLIPKEIHLWWWQMMIY